MKMKFKIYQLKDMRGTDYGFMGWDFANDHGFKISDYNEVYAGERNPSGILENLFEEFNINRPDDFKGHSLSVSDVVAIETDDWRYYYCDRFGWEDITEVVNANKETSEIDYNMLLWNILKDHFGHKVEIAIYGDPDDPASVTLEDMDTGTVILDAEIYTICARED